MEEGDFCLRVGGVAATDEQAELKWVWLISTEATAGSVTQFSELDHR